MTFVKFPNLNSFTFSKEELMNDKWATVAMLSYYCDSILQLIKKSPKVKALEWYKNNPHILEHFPWILDADTDHKAVFNILKENCENEIKGINNLITFIKMNNNHEQFKKFPMKYETVSSKITQINEIISNFVKKSILHEKTTQFLKELPEVDNSVLFNLNDDILSDGQNIESIINSYNFNNFNQKNIHNELLKYIKMQNVDTEIESYIYYMVVNQYKETYETINYKVNKFIRKYISFDFDEIINDEFSLPYSDVMESVFIYNLINYDPRIIHIPDTGYCNNFINVYENPAFGNFGDVIDAIDKNYYNVEEKIPVKTKMVDRNNIYITENDNMYCRYGVDIFNIVKKAKPDVVKVHTEKKRPPSPVTPTSQNKEPAQPKAPVKQRPPSPVPARREAPAPAPPRAPARPNRQPAYPLSDEEEEPAPAPPRAPVQQIRQPAYPPSDDEDYDMMQDDEQDQIDNTILEGINQDKFWNSIRSVYNNQNQDDFDFDAIVYVEENIAKFKEFLKTKFNRMNDYREELRKLDAKNLTEDDFINTIITMGKNTYNIAVENPENMYYLLHTNDIRRF